MIFISENYIIFLVIIFVVYWYLTRDNVKAQNILLLASSYYFYASWDLRFLLLLIVSTSINYLSSIKLYETTSPNQRRFWFYCSLVINLGMLGIFKLPELWFKSILVIFPPLVTDNSHSIVADALLPIGLSFYTFCGLSYIIDIFRNKMAPSRNFIEYAVFIGFFPAILAGPIERASHLLPQLQKVRKFDYGIAVDGLRQILWGLFKKLVIADGCALYVNMIFDNPVNYSGSTLAVGAIMFSFQLYADFSGYSDLALGSARLLGIELFPNFAFPYFSRDIVEFWRRWHISLNRWFRDYVFYPLERRRSLILRYGGSTMIVFLLTGLWHGTNWTFVVWGGLNAFYIIFFLFFNKTRTTLRIAAQGKSLPTLKEVFQIGSTFGLTSFAWIFFRADNIRHASIYIYNMFSWSLFTIPDLLPMKILILIIIFMGIEWLGREQQYAIAGLATTWPRPLRWSFYYILIFVIFYFSGSQQHFIYFNF